MQVHTWGHDNWMCALLRDTERGGWLGWGQGYTGISEPASILLSICNYSKETVF